jgi:hypothetical protein
MSTAHGKTEALAVPTWILFKCFGWAGKQDDGNGRGKTDSWYAPRKNRNAMSQNYSMRNQTNILAQIVDFQ